MILIEDYMNRSQLERQEHLKLDDPCLERGGQSMYLKGLLAHICDTTIPSGRKIHVCHACHNSKCSNPNHIYWGTPRENRQDFISTGNDKTIWKRTVEKYGLEEAKLKVYRSKEANALGGRNNKGKPKSEEHKRKISEALKKNTPV